MFKGKKHCRKSLTAGSPSCGSNVNVTARPWSRDSFRFAMKNLMLKVSIVWFPHGVDRYVVAWLSCFAKIFCASHKNVSSVFRFPDCTLEKQLSTQENWIYT